MHVFIRLVFAAVFFSLTIASSGDRSDDFQTCVARCDLGRCQQGHTLPFPLQLTLWTCQDDCKYKCMHAITDRDISRNVPVQQYYGKWPFWRLLGMQEPASVAFSLMNLWCHVKGASKIRRLVPDAHPMKFYYLVWSWTSINAWVWSSVFHTRDLPLTEKLDYFSAALSIIYALYYTVIRLFHLYPHQSRLSLSSSPRSATIYKFWSSLCIVAYVAHVSYLSLLPRFDYTYNMAFNLTIGVMHNLLWLLFSLPTSLIRRFPSQLRSYRPEYATKASIFVVLTTAATALELFDFPPWGRIIDAHALWHLSTVPISLFWYSFLAEDALASWREQKT